MVGLCILSVTAYFLGGWSAVSLLCVSPSPDLNPHLIIPRSALSYGWHIKLSDSWVFCQGFLQLSQSTIGLFRGPRFLFLFLLDHSPFLNNIWMFLAWQTLFSTFCTQCHLLSCICASPGSVYETTCPKSGMCGVWILCSIHTPQWIVGFVVLSTCHLSYKLRL